MLQRTLPAGFIAPCLPTKTDKLPPGSLWLHEIKHDGFRIIARKNGAQVRLYSRTTMPLTSSATNASQSSQRCTGRAPIGLACPPTKPRKRGQWRAGKKTVAGTRQQPTKNGNAASGAF